MAWERGHRSGVTSFEDGLVRAAGDSDPSLEPGRAFLAVATAVLVGRTPGRKSAICRSRLRRLGGLTLPAVSCRRWSGYQVKQPSRTMQAWSISMTSRPEVSRARQSGVARRGTCGRSPTTAGEALGRGGHFAMSWWTGKPRRRTLDRGSSYWKRLHNFTSVGFRSRLRCLAMLSLFGGQSEKFSSALEDAFSSTVPRGRVAPTRQVGRDRSGDRRPFIPQPGRPASRRTTAAAILLGW